MSNPAVYRRRLLDLFLMAVKETEDALTHFNCADVSELHNHIDANEIVMGLIDHVDTVAYDDKMPSVSQQLGWDVGNAAQILAEVIVQHRRDMENIDQ